MSGGRRNIFVSMGMFLVFTLVYLGLTKFTDLSALVVLSLSVIVGVLAAVLMASSGGKR